MVHVKGVFLKKSKAFTNMVNTLTCTPGSLQGNLWPGTRVVSKETLGEWERTLLVDRLKGWRLGQSFCEYFGVPNSSPLYWFRDGDTSRRWIQNNYLKDTRN